MSVGCQCVTFVLKQDPCSRTASFCLSFANALPSMATESSVPLNPTLRGPRHVTFGALLCLLPAGTRLSLPAWDSLAVWCLSFLPWLAPDPCGQRQPRESFLLLCLPWLLAPVSVLPGAQVQRSSGGRVWPPFMGVVNVPIWGPLINGKQLCPSHQSWFRPCVLTVASLRPSKAAEIDKETPLSSQEASV